MTTEDRLYVDTNVTLPYNKDLYYQSRNGYQTIQVKGNFIDTDDEISLTIAVCNEEGSPNAVPKAPIVIDVSMQQQKITVYNMVNGVEGQVEVPTGAFPFDTSEPYTITIEFGETASTLKFQALGTNADPMTFPNRDNMIDTAKWVRIEGTGAEVTEFRC